MDQATIDMRKSLVPAQIDWLTDTVLQWTVLGCQVSVEALAGHRVKHASESVNVSCS